MRLTVADVDKALALYRDALGMAVRSVGEFKKDPDVHQHAWAAKDAQYRAAMLEVPDDRAHLRSSSTSRASIGKIVRGNIQDPGSTRMQLQVRDVDAAIAALKRPAARSCRRAGPRWNCRAAAARRQRSRSCATQTICSWCCCRRRHRLRAKRRSVRLQPDLQLRPPCPRLERMFVRRAASS